MALKMFADAKGVAQQIQIQAQAPVTVHKPAMTVQQEKSELQKLVDEMVLTQQLIDNNELDKILKRKEELRKQLAEFVADMPLDAEATLEGTLGRVTFSNASVKTVVTDKEKMIDALGADTFKMIAAVSMTDLKKYLSENEIATFSDSDYGSRTLKKVESKAS